MSTVTVSNKCQAATWEITGISISPGGSTQAIDRSTLSDSNQLVVSLASGSSSSGYHYNIDDGPDQNITLLSNEFAVSLPPDTSPHPGPSSSMADPNTNVSIGDGQNKP